MSVFKAKYALLFVIGLFTFVVYGAHEFFIYYPGL